ncbi:MAG TPA: VOC family protein [Pyrinomonadaceae bacterium]|nr:VOC family protein [Pyrinomonadaceae bacterium]
MSALEDGKGRGAASNFRVSQIDHVHVYVADRRAAACWYKDVLGLEVCHDIEGDDDGGPLVVSSDGGSTGLALFKSRPTAARTSTTVAFRVGGAGFLEFLGRLASLKVEGGNGRTLAASDVVDHDYCYSLYFNDPDGNPYELTTYDYDDVRVRLEGTV